MKRYLLFVIAFVCVSIGAWAGPEDGFVMSKDEIGTWFVNTDASLGTEKVIKVNVSEPDGLKHALDKLSHVLAGPVPPDMQDFVDKLNEGGNYVADNKLVLQVVNTSGSPLALSQQDIAALASINIPTIDLQDLNPASTFTFANPNVKRVILPDAWDKTAVTAAAEAIIAVNTNFESTYSIDGPNGAVVAYVNKPGTLYTAMRHMYGDATVSNPKLAGADGAASGNNFRIKGLTDLTLLGTPSARDFNGADNQEAVKFDPAGHFVFDREADETSMARNAGIGGTRQLLGTQKDGAIVGAQLARLDLGDAIITDAHCSDLTISWSYSAVATSLKEIIFPTTTDLTTLPADCLNGDYAYLEEFCIPGNIKKLKTRACWISTQVVRHIWTTGSNSNLIYDYGAYTIDPDNRINPAVFDHTGHAPLSSTVWNCGCGYNGSTDVPRYGTITLPEGLELIESHCFTSRNISDVYSLNPVAPECHVDAFSTIMYLGNNTIDTQYINEMGMVTREAYAQSVAKGEYITFLHYPRGIGTPQIQRYTDPTRQFSVATTLRDGKGNIIYFPNQSELNRAYIQGTTGYLWFAWDSERVPEGHGGDANSFKNANPETSGGHTTQLQQTANDLYIANQMTNPDKTDRSFYDVRLDTDGQPTLEKPGDLNWYYYTKWEGVYLYPEMEYQSQTTSEPIAYVQTFDANGNPIYEQCSEGNYVKDEHYVTNAEGTYVNVPSFDGYVSTTTSVPEIDTYYSDNQGEDETTPKVSGTFYVENGTKPVYTQVDKNNDAIGAQDQYYKKNGDVYTPSYLMFNTTYYYPTGNRITVPKYVSCNYTVYDPAKTYYTESNGVYTEVLPNFNGTTYYYENGEYKQTSVAIEGVTEYYQNYGGWTVVMPQISQYYYYADGTEEIDEWISSDHFIPGKTWYAKNNDGTYTEVTLTWYTQIPGNYYYVSDIVPNYSSANGQDYSAYVKYYTDANGATEASTVNFDKTYYYASYTDHFETYTDQEGQRYNLVEYYRVATAADGDAQRYCPVKEPVYGITKNEYTADYRGWHQFVLAAYAPYGDPEKTTTVKFYQTDSDWWTVCLPYDLKYTEMKDFFGNGNNIPYLSKLRYVVRDYDKRKITLMFSKNLMVYKENITGENVHGDIDDVTTWTAAELEDDPIILHKGVPYLIKPQIPVGANRQFDVAKQQNENLYQRLVDAENVGGGALETYIYKGQYTVPAYVVGTNAPEETVDYREFEHYGEYSKTYYSANKIKYEGQEVEAKISNQYSYTFVGSFFLSVLPHDCYFLGWDSQKNRAAFWYNKVPKLDKQEWNNQTGVICANFDREGTLIHHATSLADPARWIFAASSNDSDDLLGIASSAPKNYGMGSGGAITILVDDSENPLAEDFGDQDVLSIDEIQSLDAKGVWYNVNGQKLNGRPTQNGVYIMNGKKYVVK